MADITITAANVVAGSNAVIGYGTAGATITAGQTLYADSSDSDSLKLADADDTAAKATVVGIALHGASDGQPLQYIKTGTITIGGTVAVGTVYVQSGTAGGIAPVADLASGDYTTTLGIGKTASTIDVRIHNSGVQVPA